MKYSTDVDPDKTAKAYGYELHCSRKDSMNLAYAIRGMKPDIFDIYKFTTEWEHIKKHSTNREYQHFLEDNILMFNENVFRQLIVLGANLSSSKSFMDLNSKEKEEVLIATQNPNEIIEYVKTLNDSDHKMVGKEV